MKSAPAPREAHDEPFRCPDCGQMQRGGSAGSVVACAGCGHPVTVPAAKKRPKVTPRPPQPTTAAGHVPWGRVALAAGLVAALHLVVYLILTSEARASMREIESKHSAAELENAQKPSVAPRVGTEAYAKWRANEAAHQAAHTYGRHEAHHDLVRNGILLSFFAQTLFVAWVLARVAGRAAASARRAAARRSG